MRFSLVRPLVKTLVKYRGLVVRETAGTSLPPGVWGGAFRTFEDVPYVQIL
jgi:hypothetical protein